MSDRNTERRLRYALDKAGYLLCKSGVKNINPDNLGGYMIIDKYGNYVVAGSRFEYTFGECKIGLPTVKSAIQRKGMSPLSPR